jgi:phospholipid/cholesterol/gamma-HCH transport system ATP-binding protein
MIIEAKDIVTRFDDKIVHNGVSFHIKKGEIYGLLGGSGSGKTTLLRQMILLQKPTNGQMIVLGKDINKLSLREENELRQKWGVLFQFGALFSSITVLENIMLPLKEYTKLPDSFIEELAFLKLKMVGLSKESAYLYPSQLSGGMKKRAALARALALDPEVLFLDEPTSGLDPSSARALDKLILQLREYLDITIVMVTHDKDTISNVLDRFIILGDGKVQAEDSLENLKKTNLELIKEFLE